MIAPLHTLPETQSPQQIGLIIAILFAVFCFSVGLTVLVRWVARRFGIVDAPGLARKIHTKPVALLGGTAVISTVIIAIAGSGWWLLGGYLLPKHLIGIVCASAVLLVGGALDDARDLKPQYQIIFPVIAACIVIASGIGIDYITNPFGGVLRLDSVSWTVFTWKGTPYHITILSDVFTLIWILVMTYTTKFLDGLDGLVSGVSVIGLSIIALLSFSAAVLQPETGMLALIGAAAFAGFLVFNWNPASIFLGESGSLFAGFFLGVLAIVSGGKIATALLILGIPLLDVVWVVFRRFVIERRSPFQADRKHMHLRLIDAGLSQKQAVFVLYVLTLLFGVSSLYLQSEQKLSAFVILIFIMVIFAAIVVRFSMQPKKEKAQVMQDESGRMTPKVIIAASILLVVGMLAGLQVLNAVQEKSSYPDEIIKVTIGDHVYMLEVANTPLERERGLMNRASLENDHGMLFVFPASADVSFWMKNTLIPLDVVWVQDNSVLGVTENMVPQPDVADMDLTLYPSPGPVNKVIELPAGTIERNAIQAGQTVFYGQKEE